MSNATNELTRELLDRRFSEACEEVLGADVRGGVDSLSAGLEYGLPWVVNEEDVLKVARVFCREFIYENPYIEDKGRVPREGVVALSGSFIAFLNDYMPSYDRMFKGMNTLVGMESFGVEISPLACVFDELKTGTRLVPEGGKTDVDRVSGSCRSGSPRDVIDETPRGMVRVLSPLRRKSDGKRPAYTFGPDGERGFTAEDDVSLRLYERYRALLKADRMEAVDCVKAALEYAFYPLAMPACEVSYSLLDALEASAHNAVLKDGGNSPRVLEKSRLALKRCNRALGVSGLQGGC